MNHRDGPLGDPHFCILTAAFQRLNRIPEMLAQLQLFLQEDPKGQLADYFRKTIAELQGQSH